MHRNFLITAFITAITIAGFAETLNFKVAGTARNCVVHVPTGTTKPAVVFFLHGAGGSGSGFENDTKADVVADREKFIAAYPSGIGGNWNYNDGSDDFTFILALIDTIDARYHIDRNKLYVTGFSMGGGMTFAIGCRYSDVFAAMAPTSAAGTACTPKRKLPMLLTFGTQDLYPIANFMAAITRWNGYNGCPAAPVITRPYPTTNPQSVVTRLTYGPCAQGVEVVADSIHNGTHEWPMDTKTKVNNSEEVWAFFKRFSLNQTENVPRQTVSFTREDITASYASGIVFLHGAAGPVSVRVLDTKGTIVFDGSAVHGRFSLKNKPSGVYILWITGMEKLTRARIVAP